MLNDKVILVTGGTGSFGKKFLEMVFEKYTPKKVIIYSRDEYKQSLMQTDYKDKVDMKRVRFFIGDVRDKERMSRAFDGVDYVIHAAAMKQVPTCEYNPMEAIKTNIHGAQNVIEAALDRGVKKVVALSTDKAVNPTNIMGASKRLCEMVVQMLNRRYPKTDFVAVRFGNVLGSNGCRNLRYPITLYAQMEDLPYNLGGFFINNPVQLICGILDITIGRICAEWLSCLTFRLKYRPYLSAGILGVKLVKDVDEGRHIVIHLIIAVNTVVDSNKADIRIREDHLRVHPDL